jgi:hypothetical protein
MDMVKAPGFKILFDEIAYKVRRLFRHSSMLLNITSSVNPENSSGKPKLMGAKPIQRRMGFKN